MLLDLYYYTRKESYAQAVHKMLDTDTEWPKPSAIGFPSISVIRPAKYRSLTGDKSFDGPIVEPADAMLLDESDNRPALVLVNKSTEQFLGRPGLAYIWMFKDRHMELNNRRPAFPPSRGQGKYLM